MYIEIIELVSKKCLKLYIELSLLVLVKLYIQIVRILNIAFFKFWKILK